MSEGLLLRRVEIEAGRVVDVRVRDDVVSEIDHDLRAGLDEEVIDAQGNALIPGLHDHHAHVLALAAALRSVRCGPSDVAGRAGLAKALRDAADGVPPGAWIRGISYHESVAGPLDRVALDEFVSDRPVRMQHRSGALWMLNSAGLAAIEAESFALPGIERDPSHRATGRLWRLDAWLRERTRGDQALDLGAAGRRLAALGITGVTDATPDLDRTGLDLILRAAADGALPQRMHLLGVPHGTRLQGRASVGPRKILLADHDLPPLKAIAEDVRSSHSNGRPVAVHCVTREALLVTLAALHDIGPLSGDRIEHAAVVPEGTAVEIARLGVRVVTQPAFLAERGDDYVRDVAPEDREHLYPYASLLAARVRVAPSSDAPFGDIDPWRTMAAARDRLTPGGVALGVDERVPVSVTRDGYLSALDDPGGPPRNITVGFHADLCLLGVPLAELTRNPSRDAVRMTICAGRIVARDDGN